MTDNNIALKKAGLKSRFRDSKSWKYCKIRNAITSVRKICTKTD